MCSSDLGYRTLVRAVDMQTLALGGDVAVAVQRDGGLALEKQRVVSLSLLTQRHPAVLARMRAALAEYSGWLEATRYALLPEGLSEATLPEDMDAGDREFLTPLLDGQPVRYHDLVDGALDRVRLSRLVGRGLIQLSGLTPSDAAHVLGHQSQWDGEGALLGCELVGRWSSRLSGDATFCDPRVFAAAIHDQVVTDTAGVLLAKLAGGAALTPGSVAAAVASGQTRIGDLEVALSPQVPVVAVGGPAGGFFRDVGERLGADMSIPEYSGVANAVGAAAGLYHTRMVVEVSRCEKSGYVVHTLHGPESWDRGPTALARAREYADAQARARLQAMGGTDSHVEIEVERVDLPDVDESFSLVSARVTAEAVARPT